MTGDEATIDLAQAALLVAQIENPALETRPYLHMLDALARRVRALLALPEPASQPVLPPEVEPFEVLVALNRVLFEEEGFRGNKQHYYAPANSFLNHVLEAHTGIPITLSILYMEVGRRVGIQVDGIALPYHFVTRCTLPQRTLYIDAFDQGKFLTEQDCRQLVRSVGKVRFHRQWLEPVSHRHILVRMLNNLKHIYIHEEDYPRALACCERLVLLMPHIAGELRDRGLIHLQLTHYSRALHDLLKYLDMSPEASDRFEILNQVKSIRQTLAMLN